VLPLAGQQRDALVFVQLHKLRQLECEAFVTFTDSVELLGEPMLLRWTTLVHRCRGKRPGGPELSLNDGGSCPG